ncbi:MAG: hypothetical protein DHS20C21_15890 [Gemmatimonadota bacterium]|nr:MAG: hypothetical protein DHS20C21_15890 [Gemmatimonadota bacterium]
MSQSQPHRQQNPGPQAVDREVAAYIAGEDAAADRICRALEPIVRAEVRRFLPTTDADHDDVVQETLMSLIRYLRKAGQGPDRVEAFVVTMAGNRCRNLYRWRSRRPGVDLESTGDLPDPGQDPLAELEAAEAEALVRKALNALDPPCRKLLLEIYVQGRPMQELQMEAGLTTVQGAYQRKYACLKKLADQLNRVWSEGQEIGSPLRPDKGTGSRKP